MDALLVDLPPLAAQQRPDRLVAGLDADGRELADPRA